ncbi:rod shape-determining protein MreC [Zobellia galactanivorans]|uniref:Cell shape-determining protein MreC n=1 Tax=Zobellia galactanivorans (strain DSM 12802 / CCUG 47099 / CIP 106680 / NCIMB 13871 / Dsij) TaxID=63186 RepID=G0LAD2_ZOBGA|nr:MULTISPECIES: rod shape-determining protein MreC [Zobellia]MBU3028290.1 rod shape-determining protein MreC [Zobellia galactanivorans]MDO6515625.1 rod shape-determining protein MreC [Zobellia uliginosa]MDO6808573.1 rod shape-determining protein MreC [Zobellia galactanivorans]OWW26294.1 rod shape-determining protein MreC [Zobellia sp. OII3]CAZ95230.1 Rod shape-determining protein MreC [Zobellia galactanivorans]
MQQIINFIIRYKNFLLYVFLMIVSLGFTIQSHSYHQSRFFNSSNWITGNILRTSNNVSTYFGLDQENQKLMEENTYLRKLLFNRTQIDTTVLDSVQQTYTITTAKVIKNSFADPRNYITIDKGRKDSVQPDMGVITSKGILGIIENTSNNFSTVQSILNEKSNINAKIKNTDHFGSLVWNMKQYNIVQLVDIPRLVPLTIGDTIVTGGMSSIFPEGIPIGTIRKFDLNTSKSFYNIDVALFNDMTNIKNVYIVKNTYREEILELEKQTETNGQ